MDARSGHLHSSGPSLLLLHAHFQLWHILFLQPSHPGSTKGPPVLLPLHSLSTALQHAPARVSITSSTRTAALRQEPSSPAHTLQRLLQFTCWLVKLALEASVLLPTVTAAGGAGDAQDSSWVTQDTLFTKPVPCGCTTGLTPAHGCHLQQSWRCTSDMPTPLGHGHSPAEGPS